eukprot:1322261-Amorphochlora_amoeboformis.AAC.1
MDKGVSVWRMAGTIPMDKVQRSVIFGAWRSRFVWPDAITTEAQSGLQDILRTRIDSCLGVSQLHTLYTRKSDEALKNKIQTQKFSFELQIATRHSNDTCMPTIFDGFE